MILLRQASIWAWLLLAGAAAVAASPGSAASAGSAGSAGSQPEFSDERIRVLVGQLNHRSYQARESATGQLAGLDYGQVNRLVPFYKSATSPEQKMRLRYAVQQIFFAAKRAGNLPEGFIGVGHTQVDGTPFGAERSAVLVNNVVTDSPAAKAGIRPGDLIIAMDGKPIDDRVGHAFADQVRLKKPGEKIKLTVRRDDKTLELVVTLGDRNRFDVAVDTTAWFNEFSEFWRQRFDPSDVTMAAPGIGVPIIIDDGIFEP